MKKVRQLIIPFLAVLLVAMTVMAGEKPWFDMENCDFCKHLMTDPHLMENMTWEQYELSNGLMVVTTVKPEYVESFEKAMKEMEKLGTEMAEGKRTDVKMCGHCEYYGMLMASGAKFENFKTGAGYIDIITSDNPEILKKIRTYAANNDKAMAEWKAEEKKREEK